MSRSPCDGVQPTSCCLDLWAAPAPPRVQEASASPPPRPLARRGGSRVPGGAWAARGTPGSTLPGSPPGPHARLETGWRSCTGLGLPLGGCGGTGRRTGRDNLPPPSPAPVARSSPASGWLAGKQRERQGAMPAAGAAQRPLCLWHGPALQRTFLLQECSAVACCRCVAAPNCRASEWTHWLLGGQTYAGVHLHGHRLHQRHPCPHPHPPPPQKLVIVGLHIREWGGRWSDNVRSAQDFRAQARRRWR